MRDGGFEIVSRRRGRKVAPTTRVPSSAAASPPNFRYRTSATTAASDAEVSAARQQLDGWVDAAVAELRSSAFVTGLLQILRAEEPFGSFLCLGVGHFGSERAARHQLALALILSEELRGMGNLADGEGTLEVFDPVLDSVELDLLRRRGCRVRSVNDEGRIPVNSHCLCYLPHCTRQLYSNLLEANWGAERLSRLAVLGNSFAAFADASGTGGVAPWCRVSRVAPLFNERSCDALLGGTRDFGHAFSNTCLHTIDASAVPPLDSPLWTRPFARPTSADFVEPLISSHLISSHPLVHDKSHDDSDG